MSQWRIKASPERRILLEDSCSTNDNPNVTFLYNSASTHSRPLRTGLVLHCDNAINLTYDGEMPPTLCPCRLFMPTGMVGQQHSSLYCFELWPKEGNYHCGSQRCYSSFTCGLPGAWIKGLYAESFWKNSQHTSSLILYDTSILPFLLPPASIFCHERLSLFNEGWASMRPNLKSLVSPLPFLFPHLLISMPVLTFHP